LPNLDRSAALIGLATVVAGNLLYLSGLSGTVDLTLSMEPLYLRMAERPAAEILAVEPAWGPLYVLWLKPIIAAFDDPVLAYWANVYALSIGISAALYFHVLLLTRRAAPAVGAALFFVVSDFNVPLAAKVTGFASMIVLAGMALAQLAAAGPRRAAITAGAVLLAAYARPELYPAAIGLCALSVWYGYRGDAKSLSWPFTVAAGALVLALWPGAPTYGSDRLFVAFREHFAWNWSRWHGEGQTFLAIWQREFGDSHSIAGAAPANPGAIARHLFDNLVGTLRFMLGPAFAHQPLLAPATSPTAVAIENGFLSLSAFGVLLYAARNRNARRRMRDLYGPTLLSYATIAAFSFASAVLIYPVAHYLMIPGVLSISTAALAAAASLPPPSMDSWRLRMGAALLCLAAIPKPFVLPSAHRPAGGRFASEISVRRRVLDTIDHIRSLRLATPVQVLTTTDGIGEMLGRGFREIKMWRKGAQPLADYMRDHDVGVIVNLEGGQNSFVVDDRDWTVLQNTPDVFGYARSPVPGHEGIRVFVRSDLMRRP
jgi:hypothetical protein